MLPRPHFLPRSQANRDSFSAGTIGGSRGTAVKFDSTPSEFYFDSSYGGDNGLGTDSTGNSRPGSTLTLSRGGTPGFGTPASGASRPIRSSLKPSSSGGGVARQPSTSRSLRDIEMAMRSVNSFGEDIEEEDEDENDDDDGGDSISPARRYQPGKR